MTDYRKMSREELEKLAYELVKRDSLNAADEIYDFLEFYGHKVEVVKGRKVPKGTQGDVFWLKRYDNSKYGDPWGIYSVTKAGIRTESGDVYFTAVDNLKILD